MRPRGLNALSAELADWLGETEDTPRRQVRRVVRHFGYAKARRLYYFARAVQARGGWLRRDGAPRTLGGIFFRRVRFELGPAIFAEKIRKTHRDAITPGQKLLPPDPARLLNGPAPKSVRDTEPASSNQQQHSAA